MASKDGDKKPGSSGSRKPGPITIDMKPESVRVEPARSEPQAAPETPAPAEPAVAATAADAPAVASAAMAAVTPPDGAVSGPEAPAPEPVAVESTPADATPANAAPVAASSDAMPDETAAEAMMRLAHGSPKPDDGVPSAGPSPEPTPRSPKEPMTETKTAPHIHATAPDDATAAKPRGTLAQTVAAALIGGAIGLIGAYGLAGAGLWPDNGRAAISAQVALLEKKLADLAPLPTGLAAVQADVKHLKTIPEIPSVTVAEVMAILDPFTKRVTDAVAHMDALDTKIAGEQVIVRGESKAVQDNVLGRIASVEASVATRVGAVEKTNAEIAERNGKIGTVLDKAVADLDALDKREAGDLAVARGEARALGEEMAKMFAAVDLSLKTHTSRLDDLATESSKQKTALEALASVFIDLDKRTAGDLAVLRGTTGEFAAKTTASMKALESALQATATQMADLNVSLTAARRLLTETRDGVQKLQVRVTAVEELRKALDGLGARVGAFDAVRKSVEGLTARFGAVDEAKKTADGVAASLWIIDQRMANVQARLAEIDALKTALDGEAKRVGALDSRFAPVEAKVNGFDTWSKDGQTARQQAVAAIALASLKSAVDSGRPFAGELATAKTIVRDLVDLQALAPYAAKGLATDADLVQRFPKVARLMLESFATAPSGDTSVFDTLMTHASQAVKIRPAGETKAEGPEAAVSRIEARLTARDLSGALNEWQALPEPARKASADWGAALAARVDGAKILASVTADVLTKLNTPSQ